MRRAGALLVALLLPASAGAATLVLDSQDPPNVGFNDPTPVTPVTGNSGKTLGEQRINAFNAAASVWENRIASPTVIRVSGMFDAQDCEPLSGTLASASPVLVIRNFPGEVKLMAWHSWAHANAVAGEELVPADSRGHLQVTVNPDVGTSGCLTTLRWDHRVGAPFSGNDVSLFNVLMHEIGHGLGILELIDHDTGEKFNGFNDIYMHYLEDHELGRKWPALGNAQRLNSLSNNQLHWTGGTMRLHSAKLADGTHLGSGHVQMYAPNPQEGSAASHFDTELWSGLDELMEPFNGPLQDLVASHHLLQDIGWPVNHPTVRGLENVDGKDWSDIAVLRAGGQQPGHFLRVVDPRKNRLIREIELPQNIAAVDLAVVGDHKDTPASELGVLSWKAKGNATRVYIYDAMSGERVKNLGFPAGYPKSILSVPSFGASPAPEILVFGTTPAGAIKVWTKDAKSGAFVGNATFPKGMPGGFAVVPSYGGSPAPEVAVVYTNAQNGTGHLHVKDADTGANLGQWTLPTQFRPLFVCSVPSFGGSAADEVAILGLQIPLGTPELHVVDPSSGDLLLSRIFLDPFEPRGLAVLPDFGSTPAAELAILGTLTRNVRTRILVVDASSGTVLTSTALPARENALRIASVPSLGGSSADDLLVVSTAARDGKLRVYVKDGRGGQVRGLAMAEGD
ncbi:MAG: hypothetical protein VYE73_06135 [Acidobacteriota bacterium]|nr:hypothetical protein [Acidobacteriota bacterium]